MSDADQPRLGDGTYTFATRSEPDVNLTTWEPGMIHPTGGYDDIEEDAAGNLRYTLDGDLHREDGPAFILIDGTEEWFLEGVRHREDDGPAITTSTGRREFYKYGLLHRDTDEPSVIHPDGTLEYWIRGERHRDGDQPAVCRPDGQTEYWCVGERHRDPANGPALIRADGSEMYFVHGREVQP